MTLVYEVKECILGKLIICSVTILEINELTAIVKVVRFTERLPDAGEVVCGFAASCGSDFPDIELGADFDFFAAIDPSVKGMTIVTDAVVLVEAVSIIRFEESGLCPGGGHAEDETDEAQDDFSPKHIILNTKYKI